MDHELPPSAVHLRDHLRGRFPDRTLAVLPPTAGPIHHRVPGFHIFRLAPAPREVGWLYVTAGLWDATQHHGHGLEFVLYAAEPSDRHVETVTMTAYYHAAGGRQALDLGHTVPIGQPWLPRSRCDHLLVSLPYLWEPDLEVCAFPEGHIRVLWLLPITKAEKVFRREHGLEALEQRLEDAGIDPTDPARASVVAPPPGPLRRILRPLLRHDR
ncbi:suppressor of fused domain protein [Micromonospora sp. MS34]|uniref:suppressor of fused domain protein n=1 Tax=Micromonospora sp. MS34 TaxID=3385971 RepID=UPI0039A2721E